MNAKTKDPSQMDKILQCRINLRASCKRWKIRYGREKGNFETTDQEEMNQDINELQEITGILILSLTHWYIK